MPLNETPAADSSADSAPATDSEARAALERRGYTRFYLVMLIWGALLFGAAGSLAWPRAWLSLVLVMVLHRVQTIALRRMNPAVLLARLKNNRPVTTADRCIMPFFQAALVAIPVMAGLDAVRFHWTSMGLAWLAPGFAAHLAGTVVITWAMAVNPFLEGMVRIQTERGHRVIVTGPYRFVRHPMYVGCGLLFAGLALELGSWWSLAAAGAATLALAVRAGFEDRLLRRELPGYEEFTRQTRYRLLPGIW